MRVKLKLCDYACELKAFAIMHVNVKLCDYTCEIKSFQYCM